MTAPNLAEAETIEAEATASQVHAEAPAPSPTESKPSRSSRSRTRSRSAKEAAATEAAGQNLADTEPGEPPLTEQDSVIAASTETAAPRQSRNRRSRDRRGKREPAKLDRQESAGSIAAEDGAVAAAPVVTRFIDRTVGSHLIVRQGIPRIFINNVSYPPVLFFGNMEGSRNQQRVLSEIRRAARAGVHLHSTLVTLPCPLSEATEALDDIDKAIKSILEADPQGFVMPRIVFVPARGWKREYPTDIATYTDGSTGDPSLTSERFWREAEQSLATLVSHLRDYEWSGRVFGIHLERGEWFQPADQGFDRSMANREAFRDWLREKYKNNLVGLRAAWYDGNVQFHTAEIPPVPSKPNPQRAFFETRRERRTIDFYAFTSDTTARRLIALAGATKRAADDRMLVSVCYGYTFEFGHGFSGHLALGQLLECPDIDLVCGPPSYRDRKPGGAASLPAPIDSIRLHGKLWLTEDDTKTFLSPAGQDDDFNPRLSDRFQTEQAYARAMGRALATGTGIGFMDLWGEGWLDDDGLWDRIAAFTEQYRIVLDRPGPKRMADVVLLIDEKSLLHIQHGEPFFRKVTTGMREILQRSGVAYEVYLQSDILQPDFPTDARLYLFTTPYRLPADQRAAIAEKLQGSGRTLAWFFAPGSCEERPQVGGVMEESATGAVGLTLRQQEWNSEIGSRVIDPRHPLTERLNAREIGVRERLNPSFYVEDPDAAVLAEYQGSGLPSIAVKKCAGWQTVFIGEPALMLDLLRGVCKFAGVHIWVGGGDDVVYIGNGWITIHANRDGHRAVRLPQPSALFDVTDRRLVATEIREHRFFMRAGTTRTFCIGSPGRFRELGLVDLVTPEGTQTHVEAPPAPPVPSAVPPALPAVPTAMMSEDMQTLQAVLSLDLSQVEDLPFDLDGYEKDQGSVELADPADAEARLAALLPDADILPHGRRRRRRGGRGRGRKHLDQPDGSAADVPSTAQTTSEPVGQTSSDANAASGHDTFGGAAPPELSGNVEDVADPLVHFGSGGHSQDDEI